MSPATRDGKSPQRRSIYTHTLARAVLRTPQYFSCAVLAAHLNSRGRGRGRLWRVRTSDVASWMHAQYPANQTTELRRRQGGTGWSFSLVNTEAQWRVGVQWRTDMANRLLAEPNKRVWFVPATPPIDN